MAGLPLPVHPNMLKDAAGYYLASKGHDTRAIQAYLGHRNIQHTVQYSKLARGGLMTFGRIETVEAGKSQPHSLGSD